jgi:hypothetical protein
MDVSDRKYNTKRMFNTLINAAGLRKDDRVDVATHAQNPRTLTEGFGRRQRSIGRRSRRTVLSR